MNCVLISLVAALPVETKKELDKILDFSVPVVLSQVSNDGVERTPMFYRGVEETLLSMNILLAEFDVSEDGKVFKKHLRTVLDARPGVDTLQLAQTRFTEQFDAAYAALLPNLHSIK